MESKLSNAIALLFALCLVGYAEANRIRTCHSCRGIQCERTTLNATVECVDALDYCVTVYGEAQVLFKGCSLEIPVQLRHRCARQSPECHKCNTDRCNNVGAMDYACLQCDSSIDSNCAKNPNSVKATLCMAPTAPNSYCFARSLAQGRVQRGCATSVVEQENCYKDQTCLLCSPGDIKNCNNVPVSASGGISSNAKMIMSSRAARKTASGAFQKYLM